MVHLPLALLPVLLLGVTGTLATTAAANTLPTTSSIGTLVTASVSHPIPFSKDATATTTAVSHANTDTDSDTDNTPAAETFDTVEHRINRCRRKPLRCDCPKDAATLAELNAMRAEKGCPNCTCDGNKNAAERGPSGAGQLVKSVVMGMVGLAAVMAFL